MEQVQNQSKCKELTIFELMREIAELKQENTQLKNYNKLLHNKLNENVYNDESLFDGNNSNDAYSEEELANAYAIAQNEYNFV